jgi:hypothetical protein
MFALCVPSTSAVFVFAFSPMTSEIIPEGSKSSLALWFQSL